MTCTAEAPFHDDMAYCRLPTGHLTRWHEGLVTTRCPECGRRDRHTDTCSAPEDHLIGVEVVRWDGPVRPMPEPDVWVKIGIDRMIRFWEEAEVVVVDGKRMRQVDRSKLIFDAVMGTPQLIAEFLDDAEDWGRDLTRRCDLERAWL